MYILAFHMKKKKKRVPLHLQFLSIFTDEV